jgi:hypothetical protein
MTDDLLQTAALDAQEDRTGDPELPASLPADVKKRGRKSGFEWRVYTNAMLTTHRLEHAPLVECHGCAHLGNLIQVTERSGARRLRRVCMKPGSPRQTTQPDWPACPLKETR